MSKPWIVLFCIVVVAFVAVGTDDLRRMLAGPAATASPYATAASAAPSPVAVATTPDAAVTTPAAVSTTPAAPATTPPAVVKTPAPTPAATASAVAHLPAACAAALAALSASPSDAASKMPNLTNGALAQSIFEHNQLSYVLATAEWETGHFETMYEYYNSADDLNQAYDGEIGNGTYPSNDGYTFRGRGYVQLTGRANYEQMGSLLGLDLVHNPDLAADPFVAGEIAAIGMHRGSFTGVSLGNYISLPTIDFVGARAIVNDHDQASTIAGYASKFASTLAGCGGGILK